MRGDSRFCIEEARGEHRWRAFGRGYAVRGGVSGKSPTGTWSQRFDRRGFRQCSAFLGHVSAKVGSRGAVIIVIHIIHYNLHEHLIAHRFACEICARLSAGLLGQQQKRMQVDAIISSWLGLRTSENRVCCEESYQLSEILNI